MPDSYTRVDLLTYTEAHAYTYGQERAQTCIGAHIHLHALIDTRTLTYAQTHTHLCIGRYTCSDACTHPCQTHTLTKIHRTKHTHTQIDGNTHIDNRTQTDSPPHTKMHTRANTDIENYLFNHFV